MNSLSAENSARTSRGTGADNLRNITSSAAAGIDPNELIDTRPMAKALHYYILNNRDLYGLPRKFNISFDGGGAIATVSETNDIGFVAVRVEEGREVAPGIWFRVQLAGITGHKQFAIDTGYEAPAVYSWSRAQGFAQVSPVKGVEGFK